MGILSGLNPITAIGNALGGNIIDGITGGIKTIWGSKQERDQQSYELNASNQNEYAAEFQFRENRNAWDSFVNGLNRLPRPIMALGTIALFVWCVVDPVDFSVSMQAMGLIPDNMWIILGVIVAFFFGDRTIKGIQAGKEPSAAQVKQVIASQAAIKQAALEGGAANAAEARIPGVAVTATLTAPGAPPAESDAAYRAELADAGKPMSNAAVLEWNRRNRSPGK